MTTLILGGRLMGKLFDLSKSSETENHLRLIRNYRNHISHNISNIKVLPASKALELSESMLYVLKASKAFKEQDKVMLRQWIIKAKLLAGIEGVINNLE